MNVVLFYLLDDQTKDPKMCFSDDTLPSGFDVKAGDIVLYLPYSMGRLKDLWGEDAEDFRPERWLDEDGNLRQESPFKFPAFQVNFVTLFSTSSFPLTLRLEYSFRLDREFVSGRNSLTAR